MRRQFNYRNQSPNNNGYPPRNNGYQSNYYNQIPRKKPIYKKWWFWLLIAIAFIALMAFIFGRPKKKDYSINTLEKTFIILNVNITMRLFPLMIRK